MKHTTLGVAAIAALLVTAGAAAAVPGQANDTGVLHANDSANETTTPRDGPANDSANASVRRGPPVDRLPAQVPDHVTEIHRAISDFLSGAIDSLGSVVSGIAAGASPGNFQEETARNGTASAENVTESDDRGPPAHAGP